MHESPPCHALCIGSNRYRRELLSRLNLPFDVGCPEVDGETLTTREPPRLALRLARWPKRGRSQHSGLPPWSLVSDQSGRFAGAPLGKPGNHEKPRNNSRPRVAKPSSFKRSLLSFCAETGFETGGSGAVEVKFHALSSAEIEGICARRFYRLRRQHKRKGWHQPAGCHPE